MNDDQTCAEVGQGTQERLDPRFGRRSSTSSFPSNDIPTQLRLIAEQIEAAGILTELAAATDALGIPSATDLTPRQWEVVFRLFQGERVATIAAAMCISRSTVRNHLSEVFAKVGVTSQAELLAKLRSRSRRGHDTQEP